ncbi:hypothetical protein [Alcanivorax sp.]|uniref:hypothetical protein n=1 Tax=Alcanivorax sp. TaxID=1872427 RepID=UPI0032D97A1D
MRWLSALKEKLFPARQPQHEEVSAHEPREYHPAHEGETPEDLHRGRHRLKETYTSHWDLDYMPRDELEEVLSDESDKPDGDDKKKPPE